MSRRCQDMKMKYTLTVFISQLRTKEINVTAAVGENWTFSILRIDTRNLRMKHGQSAAKLPAEKRR